MPALDEDIEAAAKSDALWVVVVQQQIGPVSTEHLLPDTALAAHFFVIIEV